MSRPNISAFGMAALAAVIVACPVSAATIRKSADGLPLQPVLDRASPGDVIVLQGEHQGPVTIDKTLTLEGEPGALVMGNGKGSVITVKAPQSIVRGLEVRGSGKDLYGMDSGIFVAQTASGARVEKNTIIGNLVGIYLHGARDSWALGNRIIGLREGRISEAGDGISVWNAPGARVVDNDVSYGRDGIFSKTSKRNVFRGNRFRELRFAVHYMYTNDSEISDNVSTGNAVGYAIMYSDRLKIKGNRSDGDRDHGLLLNYANNSRITGNIVVGRLQPADRWLKARSSGHGVPKTDEENQTAGADRRLGPKKCVFIYNANKNRFRDNVFEGCAIGIHFTAGSEGNLISSNSFINNRNQVKCGNAPPRLVVRRTGQLLERQSRFRPGRRRYWRQPLQAQRSDRQGVVDLPTGKAADHESRGPGHPLGAGAVSGNPARRRRRQPPADGAGRKGGRAMSGIVEIAGVSKCYGDSTVVRDISFGLGAAETVAVVGHNGAGKTTLIKLMLGLIRPTKGLVRVLGENPATGDFAVRQRLGYLPESVSFNMALTGRETLRFYARLKQVDGAATGDLFERVGLAQEAVDRPVRTYSKGMRQRLGLAQALLGMPRILLLDEPTSGLDPALRRNFYELITELRAKGTTVLLSSHALTELEGRADRVIIVNKGVKIADGTLEELRRIARLPTRISLKLSQAGATPAWLNGGMKWCRGPDGAVDAEVSSDRKIALLHDITSDAALLSGLTITEPTLDDLYAHFLNGGVTK